MNQEHMQSKSVYIWVYNSLGEIFIPEIPKPDPKKQYYQKYGVGAAGKILKNESATDAAKRVLNDQLGLEGNLIFVGEKEFDQNGAEKLGHFFILKYDNDVQVNQEYAEKGQFVPPEVVENMILQDSDIFAPAFVVFWDNFKEKLV